MDKIELSLEKARDLAAKVVEDAGADFVYHDNYDTEVKFDDYGNRAADQHGSGCRYEFKGEACCLVGRILNRAGLDSEQLNRLDTAEHVPIGLNERAQVLVEADDKTWQYLSDLQRSQDSGDDWGTALSFAEGNLDDV